MRLSELVERARFHSYSHAMIPMTARLIDNEIGVVIDTDRFGMNDGTVTRDDSFYFFLVLKNIFLGAREIVNFFLFEFFLS